MLELHTDESSAIKRIDYDRETESLTVAFHKGTEYRYKAVPISVYGEMVIAPSIGRYFRLKVSTVYESEKIDDQKESNGAIPAEH